MNNLVFLIFILVLLILIVITTNFNNFSNLGSTGGIGKNNIYFIHINKTSGSYIKKRLLTDYIHPDTFIAGVFDNSLYPPHTPPKYMPEINFNNYITTFTVVRNPYYRIISYYNMKIRRPTSEIIQEDANDINVFISKNLYNNMDSKENFGLFLQVEYLYDFYGNRVGNILHLENIKEEFNNFAKKYSIDVVYDDTDYVNKTENPSATFDDLNQKSKKLIQKYYSEDFTTFGYLK